MNRVHAFRAAAFILPAVAVLAAQDGALAQELVARGPLAVLEPASTTGGQAFGTSVSNDSGLAAFGAPGASSGAGLASVFERGSSNSWSLASTLVAADAAPADGFGSSIALEGDLILVGAPRASGPGSADQGAAYLFRDTGGSWTQVAKLVASDGALDDAFGSAVSIDGDTIVIGAPEADIGAAADRGAVYVFTNISGDTWTESAKLLASDGAAGDGFGAAVAARSGRILVGAPAHGAGAGSAYLFRSVASTWSEAEVLGAGEGGAIAFGWSVALSSTVAGDWATVGAPLASTDGILGGAAFVFERATDTNWPAAGRLSASDGALGDQFGAAVSAWDDRVVVGAPGDDVDGLVDAGSAYSFRRYGAGSWQSGGKLAAPEAGAAFGSALSLAGERVMVGAPDGASAAGLHFKIGYAKASIDDNGRDDVFWFNPSSGRIAAWSMNGLSRDSGSVLAGSLGTAYEYCGVGDLWGDGRAATVFRHKTTGAYRAWRLDGFTVTDDQMLSGNVAAEWKYIAMEDVSGDGKADLIHRHSLTDVVSVWIMDGASKTDGAQIGVAAGLEFLACADIDADGRSDLLWRTDTGEVRVWILDGPSVRSDIAVAGVGVVPSAWRVVAAGDLDGDGDDDILWRHVLNGNLSGWLMQDAARVGGGSVQSNVTLNWRVESTADLDGDGREDLVWRNLANGDLNAWTMDGVSKLSGGYIQRVSRNWSCLNDDDYNDDHGRDGDGDDDNRDDSDDDDNDDEYDDSGDDNSGSGGGSGGGSETLAAAAFNATLAISANATGLPLLEAEVEREGSATYCKALHWRNSSGELVRVVVNASSLAVVSTTSWVPSAAEYSDYADEIAVLGLVTRAAGTAVNIAVSQNPGTEVHSIELDEENSGPFWELELRRSNGTAVEVSVAAD